MALPNITGDYTFKPYAQLWPTGRILDIFLAIIGGTKMLDIIVILIDMLPSDQFKGGDTIPRRSTLGI